jgi:hypothetical protein
MSISRERLAGLFRLEAPALSLLETRSEDRGADRVGRRQLGAG